MVCWEKELPVTIRPDLFSVQPYILWPLTRQFLPLGYSFCIYNITIEKGEAHKSEKEHRLFTKYTDTKQGANSETSFKRDDTVPGGSSSSCSYTLSPSPLFQEEWLFSQLLSNLQLPKTLQCRLGSTKRNIQQCPQSPNVPMPRAAHAHFLAAKPRRSLVRTESLQTDSLAPRDIPREI